MNGRREPMDDLIKRQDAITAYCEHECGIKGMTRENCGAIDCGTIFDDIPSAQPQWTPCSERLPEEDFWSGRGRQFSDHVFVTIVNHVNDDERFTDIAQTVDGIWQLSHDVDGDCSLPNWCEVIAWMPLPEPYKGEES